MLYKTMTLELLEQRPALYSHLRRQRQTLATVERVAAWLKMRHDDWTSRLAASRPNSAPNQLRSEALELALQELTDRLPAASASPKVPSEPSSLFSPRYTRISRLPRLRTSVRKSSRFLAS